MERKEKKEEETKGKNRENVGLEELVRCGQRKK